MGLFWQQQKQQAKAKSKGIRWNTVTIRWCLSIYHTSPAVYKRITSKRSNFWVLLHVNTVKKYIKYTTPSGGFNKDVIEKIIIHSKLSELKEYQKNVSLAFDEMRIQSGETFVFECINVDLIQ